MGNEDAIKDSDVINGLSIRFLKLFGMWNAINEYRSNGKRTAVINVHTFGTLVITVPYVVCQLQSFFMIEFDIQKLTFLYLHPLPASSLCYRILVFWFRMGTLCRLYNLMRNDFFNIPEHVKTGVKELYKKTSKMSNTCCMYVFIWNAGIEILYLFFPGMSVEYIQHHTGSMAEVKTGKKKIFGGWYPVPMSEFPYYEIIFVYESICLLWAATLLAVYFCLFFQLLMCLYGQFVVLGYRFANLKVDDADRKIRKNNPYNRNNSSRIYEELHQILLEHQKLLRYTDELRSVYNPLVTISLGIGVIVLIIGAVQILMGKTSDPGTIFQIIQVFSLEIMEVSLLCFGSSLIGTASSDLQFSIYCSDWYKADVKFRKAAQMLMVRSRKSSTLTAIVMYPVNLETLGAILQFTYSSTAVTVGMIE
ncbi:odorant receptor 24a-like [Halyomorpha halys]|uniref:odorant receptor 24a-like n=1 Tax=Halyomorpha halys TaxID=286706 RepID=UPI0006D51E41|nr:Odorant receptor 59 [Halyomorpha halys]